MTIEVHDAGFHLVRLRPFRFVFFFFFFLVATGVSDFCCWPNTACSLLPFVIERGGTPTGPYIGRGYFASTENMDPITAWDVVIGIIATDVCLFTIVLFAHIINVMRQVAVFVLRVQFAPLYALARSTLVSLRISIAVGVLSLVAGGCWFMLKQSSLV